MKYEKEILNRNFFTEGVSFHSQQKVRFREYFEYFLMA